MKQVDVLVAGGGVAGLMAALTAARTGASVRIVSKGKANSADIVGFNVPIGDPEDSAQRLYEDTMLAGEFAAHPTLVAHMAYGIGPLFRRLERMGLQYRRTDGTLPVRLAADSRYPRTVYYLDQTGPRLITFLREQIREAGVEVAEETAALQVLETPSGAATGLLCWDQRNGTISVHRAKAVVLATGGLGQVYSNNSNAAGITGDGYALGYEAGAELVDLEFVQFEPFVTSAPGAGRGRGVPTTLVANDGAKVTDRHGREILPRSGDGTFRGVTKWAMSLAMYKVIAAGDCTPNGGLLFDCRHIDPAVLDGYPRFLLTCKLASVDPQRDILEVAPAAHHCMGGIRIDAKARTSVPGLFACGEVAGGLHGGNRMAGNSGPDCLVFGDTAGASAAAWAAGQAMEAANLDVSVLKASSTGPDPEQIVCRLKDLMWERVGIIRSGDDLQRAVEELRGLARQAGLVHANTPLAALETRSLALGGLLIATAALLRQESRGAHYRSDYPVREDRRFNGSVVLSAGARPEDVQTRWVPLSSPLSYGPESLEQKAPWQEERWSDQGMAAVSQ